MRFLALASAAALGLLTISSGSVGQKPDNQINPTSLVFEKRGEAALAAGNLVAANDALETAVVADPKNRAAFVSLGKVAQAQQMPGKAIRYYKNALLLEPNDLAALSAEGDALVQRGAVDRAKDNLARVQKLCGNAACPAATTLAAAIAKGPPAPVQTAQVTDKVPPKGQEVTTPEKN
ncbi:tetratricopeptide repeat protein [Sphingomonas oryzagri]